VNELIMDQRQHLIAVLRIHQNAQQIQQLFCRTHAAREDHDIIIDDAAEVARLMKKAMPQVKEYRRETGDAYSFNWSIRIAPDPMKSSSTRK
jgi:hypothetical protein